MKIDKNILTDFTNQSNHNGMSNHTDYKSKGIASPELEKSKPHIIVKIIEYLPNAVVSKTIIKKTTGNITVSSFDDGEELAETTSPFDNYVQIIDGEAEVIISEKKYKLNAIKICYETRSQNMMLIS